ncbi:RING-H2 finger protein ATL38 [Apostasia shenzhenica]|uniref:RING-type E3 ubiquitin transferase n=1 Tax=Apostasia shenzhenica TaxID=1088818 RepID=A0A2H9ZWA1_9ASPA|nr:RING-H2 finger protein ATL38 [Apostasia shenzhenica]
MLGLNLVMTVIGFSVSVMFIVFVCTRLICARVQLRASRRSSPTASRFNLSAIERGVHGLDPILVSSFPTMKFGDHITPGQNMQCTVCLLEYQEKDLYRVLPYCGHDFHADCIDTWLKQHSTCPVCRVSLRNSPDKKQRMQPAQTATMRTTDSHESCEPGAVVHCQHEGQSFSPRTSHTQSMVDHFISELPGVAEAASTLAEVNCSAEATSVELERK